MCNSYFRRSQGRLRYLRHFQARVRVVEQPEVKLEARFRHLRLYLYRLYPYLCGCASRLCPQTTIFVGVSSSPADPRLIRRPHTYLIL